MNSIIHRERVSGPGEVAGPRQLQGRVLSMLVRDFNRMLGTIAVRTGDAAAATSPFDFPVAGVGMNDANPADEDIALAQEDGQAFAADEEADAGAHRDRGDKHFRAYLSAVRSRARLDHAAEQEQFQLLRHASPEVRAAAQDTLLQANLWVVPIVVRRFYRNGSGFEDLVAEGNLGLYQALSRFDAARGLRFSTYAKWWVTHAVTTAMAANAYPVKVPRRVALQLARQRRSLERPSGGPETDTVPAAAGTPAIAAPLAEVYEAEADTRMEEASDQQPETQLSLRQGLELLTEAIKALPPRQRLVIEARYGLNGSPERTLQDIGEQLGMSAEGVRKIQLAATGVLKRKLLKGWS